MTNEAIEVRLARIEERQTAAADNAKDLARGIAGIRTLLVTFVGIAFAAALTTGGAAFLWLAQK